MTILNPGAVSPGRNPSDDAEMFELAPVSLWLEDYSALKALFAQWRELGVTDLRAHFAADPSRVKQCSACIRVIKVNRKTLTLFDANDTDHLVANLDKVFRDDMLNTHVDELVQLWDGGSAFESHTVNYTLTGRRLDIQLHGRILPGHEETWDRVLIAIEDVTERETARRKLTESETYASGLFAHSPVSLWVEDFSGVKKLLDEVRERGITDFRVFTDVHPEFVARCMSEIRVLEVNRRTLELFGAADKGALLRALRDVFRDDVETHFREQLIDLWDNKLFQLREVVNYALDGTKLNLLLQFSVLPGRERDWSLVQVALTDITARKKAEAYLEYLGTHDVLTKLFNRSFFVDELNRLDRKGPHPVTIIMADLNGLKAANDELGHAAGDALLRRAGEVLTSAIEKPAYACRIGGDEFAILLPETDEVAGQAMIQTIQDLVAINNTFYPDHSLSLSMGAATGRSVERLESVVKRADLAMLDAKRQHYFESDHDRRRPVGGVPSIAAS
ncbi:sensor domain-containing diguanylate cyclase [Pseudorhodoplanes sp.]|uniref:sensor domain-containing diguanylate cyclase n=1 Tax=Pseudorhodoplanes sp. TaxID=1934341 RepID=UPI002C8E428A|nr:sensor domain-containing diguanylate cyclase [Pseudorhodoplanes sp.]HWV55515.1 sensor domain-containing diguanylate cyclase [Pseudorhodoplanes sp.]